VGGCEFANGEGVLCEEDFVGDDPTPKRSETGLSFGVGNGRPVGAVEVAVVLSPLRSIELLCLVGGFGRGLPTPPTTSSPVFVSAISSSFPPPLRRSRGFCLSLKEYQNPNQPN